MLRAKWDVGVHFDMPTPELGYGRYREAVSRWWRLIRSARSTAPEPAFNAEVRGGGSRAKPNLQRKSGS
jgi:hypothetical protein